MAFVSKSRGKQTAALEGANEKRKAKAEDAVDAMEEKAGKAGEVIAAAEKVIERLRWWPMKLYDLGDCV